jgi:uncharacterized protein
VEVAFVLLSRGLKLRIARRLRPSNVYQLPSVGPCCNIKKMSTLNKRKLDQDAVVVLPERLKTFISATMASFGCCAHDEAHCYRVAHSAKMIAMDEDGADPRLAYIAGLLHDVLDSKLQDADSSLSAGDILRNILSSEPGFVTTEEVDKIFLIIKSVGYKNIIKEGYDAFKLPVEYRCVQDADLLDAIGAVGVARCFAFSGKRNRKLFGMSRMPEGPHGISHEDYLKAQVSTTDSAVDHFFDKLLTIEPRLTTKQGKAQAKERQDFMRVFLKQLDGELRTCGDATSDGTARAVDIMAGVVDE